MRKPRHLSPDERALWDQVAARTDRLNPADPAPNKASKHNPKQAAPRFEPLPFEVGQKAMTPTRKHDVLPPLTARLRAAPVNMDAKSFGKMSRGKIKPEGRIDLHGMTMDQAHPALVDFILTAQGSGKRLVLVITGKGKVRDDIGGPIPGRHGILRHKVPQWLALAPLSGAILEIRPAHIRHGGDGAYYVYLRRRR